MHRGKYKEPPPPFLIQPPPELPSGEPALAGKAGLGKTVRIIWMAMPYTCSRVDVRSQSGPTMISMQDPNTGRKTHAGRDPSARRTPNTDNDPDQNHCAR